MNLWCGLEGLPCVPVLESVVVVAGSTWVVLVWGALCMCCGGGVCRGVVAPYVVGGDSARQVQCGGIGVSMWSALVSLPNNKLSLLALPVFRLGAAPNGLLTLTTLLILPYTYSLSWTKCGWFRYGITHHVNIHFTLGLP